MTGPRRALALGLLAAAGYLAGAAITGHLSLPLRRPLLDGFGAIPAYRYVDPPAGAATTEPPAGGRFDAELDPQAGALANVFSTTDNQVSIALSQGVIPPSPEDTSVRLVVVPLAPEPNLTLPAGLRLVGNAVRITATYQPSGTPADLRSPAQLVLAYPAPPNAFTFNHAIIRSADGRTWTRVGGTDSIGQQLVQGEIATFGFFAVGESTATTGRRHSSPWRLLYPILLGLLAVAIIAVIVIAEVRIRRQRRAGPSGRRRRPKPPRRPRPPRGHDDPWADS